MPEVAERSWVHQLNPGQQCFFLLVRPADILWLAKVPTSQPALFFAVCKTGSVASFSGSVQEPDRHAKLLLYRCDLGAEQIA